MSVPTQNVPAEEDVLGAMLLTESAIITVSPILTPASFYRESHGILYREIVALWHEGTPVDPITVAAYIAQKGLLERVGGESRIAEIVASVAATSNVGHYAEIVRDCHVRRSLGRAGQEIVKLSNAPGETEELRSQAQQLLGEVADAAHAQQSEVAADFMDEMIDEIREAYKTGKRRTGLLSGYASIDDMLLGFWPGQFIICAARPGQGKSTLALNISENVVDAGGAVAFFSYEMSKRELVIKELSRAGRIDSRLLESGQLTPDQAKQLPAAINEVRKRISLYIHDDPTTSLAALTSEATRLKIKGKLDLIVVDYVQLIPAIKAENRQVEVSVISRTLKVLAKKLDIPVLALCQMSRAIEGARRRPVLSDLRESGSLEQDADVVLFLYDESEYDPDVAADGTTEVIVKKNRKGPNDTISLAYNKRWNRFQDMPKGTVSSSGNGEYQ